MLRKTLHHVQLLKPADTPTRSTVAAAVCNALCCVRRRINDVPRTDSMRRRIQDSAPIPRTELLQRNECSAARIFDFGAKAAAFAPAYPGSFDFTRKLWMCADEGGNKTEWHWSRAAERRILEVWVRCLQGELTSSQEFFVSVQPRHRVRCFAAAHSETSQALQCGSDLELKAAGIPDWIWPVWPVRDPLNKLNLMKRSKAHNKPLLERTTICNVPLIAMMHCVQSVCADHARQAMAILKIGRAHV